MFLQACSLHDNEAKQQPPSSIITPHLDRSSSMLEIPTPSQPHTPTTGVGTPPDMSVPHVDVCSSAGVSVCSSAVLEQPAIGDGVHSGSLALSRCSHPEDGRRLQSHPEDGRLAIITSAAKSSHCIGSGSRSTSSARSEQMAMRPGIVWSGAVAETLDAQDVDGRRLCSSQPRARPATLAQGAREVGTTLGLDPLQPPAEEGASCCSLPPAHQPRSPARPRLPQVRHHWLQT
mmetsp:Transcript_71551/g.141873  ORF Transcript_71551/g.141873 Transcript_71551/m.141873 type:complete len:232 (-) Transcript_71551:17-712(-)